MRRNPVAVAWQVYSITHRAIDLGYTGLVQFLPGVIFLLPAGHVADRFDRRQIILVCYGLQALCTLALLLLARAGLPTVYPIYIVLFFVGTARTFQGRPILRSFRTLFPRSTLSTRDLGPTIFQFATSSGRRLEAFCLPWPLLRFVSDTKLQGAGIVYVLPWER